MISYQQLKAKSALFKSFTGVTLGAFAELLAAFRQACRDDLDRRDQQRAVPRQRQHGGGSKGALPTLEDKLGTTPQAVRQLWISRTNLTNTRSAVNCGRFFVNRPVERYE